MGIETSAIPTMVTEDERKYLYWLASGWTGEGHVVEMGPWLGGSSICLAAGMRAADAASDRRLHIFDNFVWRDFMADRAALPLSDGDSFRPFFENNLSEYRDLIVVHEASLPDESVPSDPFAMQIREAEVDAGRLLRWPRGEPIEILFVDGAKSWTGMRHLLRETVPELMPGKSLVVCQDYKYWGAYWVAVTLELLRDHFELTHILDANTVSFRVVSPLSPDDVERIPDFASLDTRAALQALDSASDCLRSHGDSTGAAILRVAKVRLLSNRGEPAAAYRAFRAAERAWPHEASEDQLDRTRQWLEQQSRRPIRRGTLFRLRRARPENVRRRLASLR